jgi:hypothetical protein
MPPPAPSVSPVNCRARLCCFHHRDAAPSRTQLTCRLRLCEQSSRMTASGTSWRWIDAAGLATGMHEDVHRLERRDLSPQRLIAGPGRNCAPNSQAPSRQLAWPCHQIGEHRMRRGAACRVDLPRCNRARPAGCLLGRDRFCGINHC